MRNKHIYAKPCPLCGGNRLKFETDFGWLFDKYRLTCNRKYCWFSGERAFTKDGAIRKWNKDKFRRGEG